MKQGEGSELRVRDKDVRSLSCKAFYRDVGVRDKFSQLRL